jgi:hypothetical protein
VPRASLLYAHPPEGGEGPVLPLEALAERFEVALAGFWVLWVFVGVGQRHEDDPSLEGSEGVSIDAGQTSEEIPAASLGEAPHPLSDAPTATSTRTEPILGRGVLEGEGGYGPSYGRGYAGNPLM